MIQQKTIDNFDDFMRLRQAWNELVANTEVDHAFMKHEWFAEWIKAFEVQNQLAVVTLWSDGILEAAAPIYRQRLHFRKIKADGLSFLSSAISPRCNFIAADKQVLTSLIDNVLKLRNWDILYLENIEEEIETSRTLFDFLRSYRHGYDYRLDPLFQSPYLLVKGSWEDYWQSLPQKRREYLDFYCQKRLAKAKSHKIVSLDSVADFGSFVGRMFEISGKSWKAAGGTHLQPNTPEGHIYSNFTRIALEAGWVKIYALSIDGQVIGFNYFLFCNNKYSLIRTDYDEAFKYYSPGNTLTLSILRELHGKPGPIEFDMGGGPDPYKLDWCDKIRKHVALTVGNRNLRGRSILFAQNRVMPSWHALAGLLGHKVAR